jgi:hypothetical protein
VRPFSYLKYVPLLSNREVSLLIKTPSDDYRETTGRLLCAMYLNGFTSTSPFYVNIDDVKVDLGYIHYDNRIYNFSPIYLEVIARWLQIRKQRGNERSLITTLRHGRRPYLNPVAMRKFRSRMLKFRSLQLLGYIVTYDQLTLRYRLEYAASGQRLEDFKGKGEESRHLQYVIKEYYRQGYMGDISNPFNHD